jgi:hypothetical protein
LLNDQCVIADIREKIKIFLEANENQHTTYQNLWNTVKAFLRGKFIAISVYIERTERSQLNDLIMHFKFLEEKSKQNLK